MYCNKCGTKLLEEARFCTKCGAPVSADESMQAAQKEIAAAVSLTRADFIQRKKKKGVLSPVLIPVFSLLVVGGSMTAYYKHETNRNQDVLAMKQAAEQLALQGEYEKAAAKLSDALQLRPGYAVLKENLEIVQAADGYAKALKAVNVKIQESDFDGAEQELESLKEQLNIAEGPVYNSLKQELSAKEVSVKIGKIKKEIDQLQDVSALGDKLSVMNTLSTEEAQAVKEQITNKIVQISSEEVAKLLEAKQFSRALAVVDNGLKYALDNQKLVSLKDKVMQEKLAFEQAEQERLQQALEVAKADELRNNTDALDIVDMTAELDEFGDLYIFGKVKNVATASVHSVTVHYELYDKDGNLYASTSTDVYPYYLAAGEEGAFEAIYYGADAELTAEVTKITWYLE